MVQRTFGFDPETGTPIEWFAPKREIWRTGIFVRMIQRGRRRGMVEIEPTAGVPKKRLIIPAECVKPIHDNTPTDRGHNRDYRYPGDPVLDPMRTSRP